MGKRTTENRTGDTKTRGNIWYIPRSSKSGDCFSRQHPATFPDALAADHIASWSNPGDTVLDPFMGSGTTGKMAILAGRNFIGIELDEGYFKIAQDRINQVELVEERDKLAKENEAYKDMFTRMRNLVEEVGV